MKENAQNFYRHGYSCSESILKAAAEKGYIPEEFIRLATAFSGGMSSGCLCGALAGAQLVISYNYGRNDVHEHSGECRMKAKTFIDGFKVRNKATCCRVLSGKYEFGSAERKQNCLGLVGDAAEILEEIVGSKVCQ